jgi:hypothetical protein
VKRQKRYIAPWEVTLEIRIRYVKQDPSLSSVKLAHGDPVFHNCKTTAKHWSFDYTRFTQRRLCGSLTQLIQGVVVYVRSFEMEHHQAQKSG